MNNRSRSGDSFQISPTGGEKIVNLLNNQGENGRIDIEIDKVTPCLEEVKTAMIVTTKYSKININEAFARQLKTEKWKFDWDRTKGEVYQLTLDSNRLIQGLISLEDGGSHIYVELVESAPKNIGKNKIYNGVGGHLFAIAAERSFELGYEGYITFKPKTALIKHYRDKLGAVMMPNGEMCLYGLVSAELIRRYIRKE